MAEIKGLTFITKCSDQERVARVWDLLSQCGFAEAKYSEAVIGEKDGDWRVTLAMLNATLQAKKLDFRFVWLVAMKGTRDLVVDLTQDDYAIMTQFKLAAAENIFDDK